MDKQIETTTAYIELPMDRIREGVHCFNVDNTLVEKKEDHIVLSREEFIEWANRLIKYGYDLSETLGGGPEEIETLDTFNEIFKT